MKNSMSEKSLLGRIVITIDGPAGSGKTTTAREVARRLGLRHIDTGAMYRAVTLAALNEEVRPEDGPAVEEVARRAEIELGDSNSTTPMVRLNGTDVTDEIRSPRVTDNVSMVSAYHGVRQAMVRKQRIIADTGGACMEGRDTGSIVLPTADVKIYLDASVDVRARRRQAELRAKGVDRSLDAVKRDIEERDRLDSSRELSPLTVPVGAHVIDTSSLSIDEQVNVVVTLARQVASRIEDLTIAKGEKNPFSRRRFSWAMTHSIVRFVVNAVFGVRVIRTHDADYLENFIYASNHLSNADPPLVATSIRREIYFIAKATLFRNRIFGWLITHWNARPIRRSGFDRDAMETYLGLLEQGKNIIIFPEGHRISGGRLGPPKAGIGYLAVQSGVTVIPIYIRGTNRLWRVLFRRTRLTIVHGSPIRLTDRDPARFANPESFRDFGHTVMAAIGALKDEYGGGG